MREITVLARSMILISHFLYAKHLIWQAGNLAGIGTSNARKIRPCCALVDDFVIHQCMGSIAQAILVHYVKFIVNGVIRIHFPVKAGHYPEGPSIHDNELIAPKFGTLGKNM